MLTKPSLTIFGCSWACGEWNTTDDTRQSFKVVHPGLTEYLSDSFTVKNHAKIANSLWDILFTVQNFLDFPRLVETKIMVFQTSPGRFKNHQVFGVEVNDIMSTHTTLKYFFTELVEIWYIKLQQLAEKHNTHIYLCGSLSDLELNALKLYDRLIPVCESWQQLLYPEHVASVIPVALDDFTVVDIKNSNNQALLQDTLNYLDNSFAEFDVVRSTGIYGPIDFHPTRESHRVIAEHIKQFLKSK